MLSLTPAVESILAWFDLTHDVDANGFGVARWRRTGLPGRGNVGEQDAHLMAALEYVRRISDDALVVQAKQANGQDE